MTIADPFRACQTLRYTLDNVIDLIVLKRAHLNIGLPRGSVAVVVDTNDFNLLFEGEKEGLKTQKENPNKEYNEELISPWLQTETQICLAPTGWLDLS